MWKIILLAAACLVVGFLAGGFVFMAYSMPSFAKTMFLLQEGEVIKFSWAAKDAYYNEPNQTAVWAWNYYIKAINEIAKERNPEGGKTNYFFIPYNQDLAFAHTRLGILYRKLGDVEKSKYHFDKALSLAETAGWKNIKTKEDMEEFLSKFDKATKEFSSSL